MPYNLIEVFAILMKQHIAPLLKTADFKQKHLTFYQTKGDLVFVINFQKNNHNSADWVSIFVNCGIYSPTIAQSIGNPVLTHPKEYECLYNHRINQLTGSAHQSFELGSNAEAHTTHFCQQLTTELTAALQFYDRICTTSDLVDLCIEENTYFWHQLFQYLAIKKDRSRLRRYVQRFGDIFQGDERRDWFETEINKILTTHHIEPMKFDSPPV